MKQLALIFKNGRMFVMLNDKGQPIGIHPQSDAPLFKRAIQDDLRVVNANSIAGKGILALNKMR